MTIIAEVAKELLGMFIADVRLTAAILVLAAIVAILVVVWPVEPVLGGASRSWIRSYSRRRGHAGSKIAEVRMIIGDLRSLVRRAIWAVIPVASVTVLSIAAYLGILQLSGNFHAVIPGALYRSAQPTASDIAHYNMTYGIKTIVNLRGEKRRAGWYQAEVAEARWLGITHVDFKMSAWRKLSPTQAAELIDIFQRAEKPILVHCDAGADRSGLASALYLAAVAKSGEAAAEGQLSIRYGHVSFPLFAAYAIDRTFESLEPWLGFQGS